MTIVKTIQGAYRISDIVNGQLVEMQYFGYTKCESLKMFKEHIRELT